ncbi:hypothetical protein CAPTEDRAFT_194788 [Capitella teleta]|uniref:CxC1-like cysteine cluster associated with KDZ transposases domain-containing protein n=1 Tax=Capitella teleta TaxID=283909 RepID=R7UNZ2_CAPTE|nr:hypothetical protein CAPTEDRAFT_194788 [Capitella teleta]|eukprot:ELU07833.1 hypothetical protein CAPTEDRAFT_194788 [Capitella teleta]
MRPLHFRRLWNGHKYIQADGVVVIETQHNSTCTSRILRLMDIYDCKGRHHKVKMRFCNCEKRAATLLKHRLWPARPVSPNAAYHIDFLMHEWLVKSRQQNAPTPPAKGLNLLINEKIEQLEEYYLVIKGMFRPFINGIPEMKRLPKTSYKILSEMKQNSDDTEECEVPQPEYPCPLIEEPNSEDEF